MPATPEVQALIDAAAPYDRLGPTTHLEVQTFIIAYTSGQGTNPNALANMARCENCLSQETLLEVKAYLLAVLAGLSTDTTVLTERAVPYQYIPDGYMMNVQTYLLTLDPMGPGITDPNALAQAANGFQRLSPETLLEIQVYLLALNAGLSTDPNVLAGLAKCFRCLSFPVLTSVVTDTLNKVEIEDGNGIGPGGGACIDVPADLIPVITVHYVAGVASTIDILFPQVCCEPGTFTIYESDNADMSGATDIDIIPIGGAAGEENYEVLGVDVSAATKAYLAVTQTCQGGGTISTYSNIETRAEPACAAGQVVAEDWADRVEANGAARPAQATIDAAAEFYCDLVAAGIEGKMVSVNIVAPDSLIAARTPLIKTATELDPWQQTGSHNLTINGIQADATNGQSLGVTNNTKVHMNNGGATATDCGLTIYCPVNSNQSAPFGLGSNSAGSCILLYENFANSAYLDIPNPGTAFVGWASGLVHGYYSGNRTDATTMRLYFANSGTPHAKVAELLTGPYAEDLPTGPMGACGGNSAGTLQSSDSRRYSFFALHRGLDQTESLALYNAVQALRTAFGGGFQ